MNYFFCEHKMIYNRNLYFLSYYWVFHNKFISCMLIIFMFFKKKILIIINSLYFKYNNILQEWSWYFSFLRYLILNTLFSTTIDTYLVIWQWFRILWILFTVFFFFGYLTPHLMHFLKAFVQPSDLYFLLYHDCELQWYKLLAV